MAYSKVNIYFGYEHMFLLLSVLLLYSVCQGRAIQVTESYMFSIIATFKYIYIY